MVFITAIPDEFYFLWQLEIQLHNFSQLGVDPEIIHVLIAYDIDRGLRHYFAEFIEKKEHSARFFVYPDARKHRQYLSSIRPYLVQQHIKAYPVIEQESLFYYDTDIILRELPEFDQMLKDDIWYVSDTRNYLDSTYVKKAGTCELFAEMCRTMNLSPEMVEANDVHAGGAQYVLKKTSLQFWEKVERDCEALYDLMQSYNFKEADLCTAKTGRRSEYKGIQSWCADMWAILWNAWFFGHSVKIHTELDFCWPIDDIQTWHEKKILHYSGKTDKDDMRFFRKGNYIRYPPYYDPLLKNICKDNCSYPLVQLIESYRLKLDEERIELKDITFLIAVRMDSENRLANLYYTTRYLSKYFRTNVIIAESDSEKKVDSSILPSSCTYHFLHSISQSFYHTKINNWLINNAETPFIVICDTDVIIPVKQIKEAIELLRSNVCEMVYPYDGTLINVDSLFKEVFGKILDDTLFTLNKAKFCIATKRSFGGAVFINREKYIQAGMDNEYFTHLGPRAPERFKRMRNLGYTVKRINGPLFHLPHLHKEGSNDGNTQQRIEFMEEYLKICDMKKTDLINYIETWPWLKPNKLP